MKIVPVMIMLACFSSARANGSIDETITKAVKEQMVMLEAKQERQMAQLKDEMVKKDETIAALTAALEAKTDHKQVQLTAGGEVMQLVSEAEFKELAARVADQDAKLGMTMDTLSKVCKEIKESHVGAPPALPPSLLPPLPPPRPVAKPGRRLQSSSNGNFVNELSITGSNAVVSWNSHTPGLTSFNCTGVGDGKLVCSGELHVVDVVIADGFRLSDVARLYVPVSPPPSTPPSPTAPPSIPSSWNFYLGTPGTFCPTTEQITDEVECQAAATLAGDTELEVNSWSNANGVPRGCWSFTGSNQYSFNTNTGGSAWNSNVSPVCNSGR